MTELALFLGSVIIGTSDTAVLDLLGGDAELAAGGGPVQVGLGQGPQGGLGLEHPVGALVEAVCLDVEQAAGGGADQVQVGGTFVGQGDPAVGVLEAVVAAWIGVVAHAG